MTAEDEDSIFKALQAEEDAEDVNGEGDEVVEHEGAPRRILPDPGEPTASQVEAHRAEGHVPYRSWCKWCLSGRATGEQHRCRRSERRICVFSFDYVFYDEKGDVVTREARLAGAAIDLTVLVAKDSWGKAAFMHVVPQKGVDSEKFSVDILLEDLKWLGYQRIALRSDNEPAILKLLKEALTEMRYKLEDLEQACEEHPNTYDSSGNGEIEATVKQLSGILRSNKLDLEDRIGKKIPQSHPLISWLVEYCAWIANIRTKGPDGITSYHRVRGREFGKRLVPFAELVEVHLAPKGPEAAAAGSLGARVMEGIVLGYATRSHSYVVFRNGQVTLARSVYRKPLSQRWQVEKIEGVTVSKKDMHEARGARAIPFVDREREPDAAPPRRRAVRKLELRQADFDPALGGCGWTEHCSKCVRAKDYGWRESSNMQHSIECRKRLEAELEQTARGRERLAHAREREDRWLAGRVKEAAGAAEQAVPAQGEQVPEDEELFADPGGMTTPVAVADVTDEEDMALSEEFDAHGTGVPVTPRRATDSLNQDEDMFVPSPMALLEEYRAKGADDDVRPIVDACGADEELGQVAVASLQEILNVVAELGGNMREFRRERASAMKKLVAEVYSKPRVTQMLKQMPNLGLTPGFALDLTGEDVDGRAWDFTDIEMRRRARERVIRDEPFFLIGCPPCTEYCAYQALNAVRHGWSEAEVRRRCAAAEVHLAFVCELYELQVANERYFLHEHPAYATSWNVGCIMKVASLAGVRRVTGDQCQYGQETGSGEPVKKPTGWMSNSDEVLKSLEAKCLGRDGWCSRTAGGRHQTASGRRAREAAVYPTALCRAILIGCRNQLRRDRRLHPGVCGLQSLWDEEPATTFQDLRTGEALDEADAVVAERVFAVSDASARLQYRDAVSGQPLEPALVRAARKKELEYFDHKQVWRKRPRAEALAKTGKRPISVRWIDVNKGDDDAPNYRSRLVAREIRKPGEDPIFAPTPPLESLRTVISLAATDITGEAKKIRNPTSDRRTQVSFIDISRAYFCAATDPEDPTYVELPAEDSDHGTMCGLLLKHMYGTRRAADGWHCEYAGRLVNELGFEVGDASACVFYHKARGIRCSVHGDDLTAVGEKRHLDWYRQELEKLYELKEAHRLGPGPADDKEATVLNRVVRWTPEGLEYEADPRQGEKLLRDLKLDGEGVKAAASPGVKATREQHEQDKPLAPEKTSPYRAVVARANYLAADRPELQFSSKEACRWMSAPTELSLGALKRLGRYLSEHRRLVFKYPWQTADKVEVYSDTDWGGCAKTRKSTSGGGLLLGRHLIKSWSSTQSLVSLSSGEAEFYGVVKAAGTGLGYQSLLRDLGFQLPVRTWTDSTATLGICGRQGLGKLRHIQTQYLWIQQRVRDRSIELLKVRGEENPADLFTKHLTSRDRVHSLLELFGCEYRGGRPAAAPKIRAGVGTSKGEMLNLEVKDGNAIEVNGYKFPATEYEGVLVPEAHHCHPGVLPHLHEDAVQRFPRAIACEPLGDEDPEENSFLEKRGRAVGMVGPALRTRCPPANGAQEQAKVGR